jgi:hypothetical protein
MGVSPGYKLEEATGAKAAEKTATGAEAAGWSVFWRR